MNSSQSQTKSEPARIAFAIPVAGASRTFLQRAVASVRAQTIGDWTLTIVDDSREPGDLASFVAAIGDERIRYARNAAPHGIAHGWNACLQSAPAELVTILHSDDELAPEYAAEIVALAERFPHAALYFCGATTIDDCGRPRFSPRDELKRVIQPRGTTLLLHGQPAIARLCVGNFINCPSIAYRRTRIASRSFNSRYRFVLDLAFVVDLLRDGETIVGTAARLLRYRRHAEQQTAILARDTARIDEEIAFYRELAGHTPKTHATTTAILARVMLSTRLSGLFNAFGDARRGRLAASFSKLRRCLSA